MLTVTLSAKAFNNFQLAYFDNFLKFMLKGLEVEMKNCRVSPRKWVQATISGEDEEAASHYLTQQVGICPEFLDRIRRFSALRGYVTSLNNKELCVDIGIFSPGIIDASIPLDRLQAQLADGRKLSPEKTADLFSLVEYFPVNVKIHSIEREKNRVEAALSEKQLALYRDWTKSLLDRLIVMGASFNRVRRALNMAKCNRDIIEIEKLGLLEQAIVCKLGTDAAGLIPRIGKSLWHARFSVFDPKEIMDFLGCHW